ncbi:MAG: hypoxanthine phosphoribosyltransferase [Phycisphaerales bacterium]|nr:hypoxanthine phosphoribosyltransferase [Phycisphaerales bacterium]MCI0631786.1 hypoxanthine phosphoribosyltransferase [Phycisphaerales bacterium]MCI0675102.1 hypoxanthine phosphoribosyltransferase [Phycisphaerales bacterium]
MEADIERILISRESIAGRIRELGAEIRRDLDDLSRDGEIVLVPVLTGSIIFVADLMRQLPNKVRISVVAASSYPGRATQSKGVTLSSVLPHDLAGKHVLIVDDILDSGSTIRAIRKEIEGRNPKSVRACVLVRKKVESAMATPCEYVGFDIPDVFVVGYGLDYDNYYRNLPEIGVLKREAM